MNQISNSVEIIRNRGCVVSEFRIGISIKLPEKIA